jgi:hypothetical protein
MIVELTCRHCSAAYSPTRADLLTDGRGDQGVADHVACVAWRTLSVAGTVAVSDR